MIGNLPELYCFQTNEKHCQAESIIKIVNIPIIYSQNYTERRTENGKYCSPKQR
jgi:hypothetical protein